jgi:hypothetical protein
MSSYSPDAHDDSFGPRSAFGWLDGLDRLSNQAHHIVGVVVKLSGVNATSFWGEIQPNLDVE